MRESVPLFGRFKTINLARYLCVCLMHWIVQVYPGKTRSLGHPWWPGGHDYRPIKRLCGKAIYPLIAVAFLSDLYRISFHKNMDLFTVQSLLKVETNAQVYVQKCFIDILVKLPHVGIPKLKSTKVWTFFSFSLILSNYNSKWMLGKKHWTLKNTFEANFKTQIISVTLS